MAVVGSPPGVHTVPVSAHPRLTLLGGFRLEVGGSEVGLARGEQRLVALLALRASRHKARRQVAATLWPERGVAQAHACLRSCLWRLRQDVDIVDERRDEGVRLADEVDVDVSRLTASSLHPRADTAIHPAHQPVELGVGGAAGAGAAAALAGELLPDWDEDWVVLDRERLHQLSLHVLEAQVRDLAERGRFLEACDVAHAAIAMDDLRESSHRALIRVYLAEGNYAEALRHARDFRRRLQQELGLDPSPLLDELLCRAGPRPAGVERSS